jgi:hypothetical protein
MTWGFPNLLLLGLPIVALPVLIHLINMLRHRRVEWAAMEFLLLSQKKHRTWIILKQLLLLLMRMAAIAAVVLIVARPRVQDRWGSLLGTDKTHHIILLDDSFSMSDRWGDTSAFDQAKKVMQRVGEAAVRQPSPQVVSLLRFSKAGQYGGGLQPEIIKEQVDKEFSERLAGRLKTMEVSQTAAEPVQSLEAVGKWLGDDQGERRIVYIISDFRARQWAEPTELRKRLLELNEQKVEVRLVDCVESAHANLAVTSLVPEQGLRAVDVAWNMEITVQNFGTAPAEKVPVVLTTDQRARPGLEIAKIPPGGKVTQRFEVHFDKPGERLIKAQLDADAVAADNTRYSVVELVKEMPVLLLDSDGEARDAKSIAVALAPGGPVRSGIQPKIELPTFLTRRSPEEMRAALSRFSVVTLANVERLDESAVAALEKYVADGGGLAVFVGQRGYRFLKERLYQDGRGLFPLPVEGAEELRVDRLEKAPDMNADEHFIFSSFANKRNEFLGRVRIWRYAAATRGWKPPADSTTRILARLRNGAPLIVEKTFGKGRVIAILTTAYSDPDQNKAWNNWAREQSGTFPAVLRDLHAYLGNRPGSGKSYLVGGPLQVKLPSAQYEPQVRLSTPKDESSGGAIIDATLDDSGQLTATLPQTDVSGFYETQLTAKKGGNESRMFAVNVDPLEGDLNTVGKTELSAGLADVDYRFESAAEFASDDGSQKSNLSQAILYALIVLLIGEQILAWSCSYHPTPRGKGAKGASSPPLSPGEGRDDGSASRNGAARRTPAYAPLRPHPNPLPEGEGTGVDALHAVSREGGTR